MSLAAAAGTLAGGAGLAAPTPVQAQSALSPRQALKELLDGNRRFVKGQLTACNASDLAARKQETLNKQEPFAALLACADSRVPAELIFDQNIGRLFVTRVAGNIASSEMIASLEYGVAVLGAKALMVLGHAHCGAVKAAIDAKAVPGQISTLYPYIRPAVERAGRDLEAAIKMNAKIQAGLLRDASPVIANALDKEQLEVVAAYYDLASGSVSVLG
jgi:carbonic anhydrase